MTSVLAVALLCRHVRAYAVVSCQGEDHVVGHGDLIGRTPTAGVVVDDPRVSEAHAIVSLRKGVLYLLSLRRLVIADGAPSSEVRLVPGLRITLIDELELVVREVSEPPCVLAVVMPSGERLVLPQVASFTLDPPRMHPRLLPTAAGTAWSTGERWTLRTEGTSRPIEPGSRHLIGGQSFEFALVSIGDASVAATDANTDGVVAPLRLVAFYDSVQLYQRGKKVHTVGGMGARLLSELVACGGPTRWDVLARELWPAEDDTLALRHRWDVALSRLRARLRQAGVRDLLQTDGTGQISLEMYAGDQVEDRT